jgi:serine protease Do
VVGINTAIIAGGQGIGFAIPVNMAKGIIKQLADQRGSHPRLAGHRHSGPYQGTEGLLRVKGMRASWSPRFFPVTRRKKPAFKAKDIILEVNGKKVDSSRELSRTIAESPVGEKTKLLLSCETALKRIHH